MRRLVVIFCMVVLTGLFSNLQGQSTFSVDAYADFLENNQNLTTQKVLSFYPPPQQYYSSRTDTALSTFLYLDSIASLYQLTDSELSLLKKHHFMVSERLSYNCFGEAFHDVYAKDMPVMVTTDAVLHALHYSYDTMLFDLERILLTKRLGALLKQLWDGFPTLYFTYKPDTALTDPLKDVDLYLTIAYSLFQEELLTPRYADVDHVREIWEAIQSEQFVNIPLFTYPERLRRLDFSQFTVRGHYNQTYWDSESGQEETLDFYFKTMMWLGRMEFWLTAPPPNPWELPWQPFEIKRMVLGSSLLNELLDDVNATEILDEFETILQFLIGESDNLTPLEYSNLAKSVDMQSSASLLQTDFYNNFINELKISRNGGQKILSAFMLFDPFSSEPDTLPISYRLMGQRFIVDSYIFGSLVFPNIFYENKRIWRPMPDPLDAMFVLGNDNALPLLADELDMYHYGSQINGLRYLVDAYDDDFWEMSLYNVWLDALRTLNPQNQPDNVPYFMKTVAWQQEKINTQLASWAQLRHDNLLYAKQSYTGGTACSYPYSFVEPYPEFYGKIADYADRAKTFFASLDETHWLFNNFIEYLQRLYDVTKQLEGIAQKECDGKILSDEEILYLKRMLFEGHGSGAPPFDGWYSSLFYDPNGAAEGDFVIADVHTQPTEFNGAVVGKVLHVGVGKINLGVFLASAPVEGLPDMAFVGPVMSYYETITNNFKRMTDEEWTKMVEVDDVPNRPDWVNIYLADKNGSTLQAGKTLQGTLYSSVQNQTENSVMPLKLSSNYPNPFNPITHFQIELPESENIKIVVINTRGQIVEVLADRLFRDGIHQFTWNAEEHPSGLYFLHVRSQHSHQIRKMILLQ